jgi:uncharacterized protein YkwD
MAYESCKNAPMWTFCKHCCTLSAGVRRAVRRFGALLSAALALTAGALVHGLGAATALAKVKRRAEPCAGVNARPSAANGATMATATVCLIDRMRLSHGLRALHVNRDLSRVAADQVKHMVRADYFADVRPSGVTPASLIAASAYAFHTGLAVAGQNIGWATGSEATPVSMLAAWMASPPHRALILKPSFRDVGVGVSAALPSVLGQRRPGALYAVEFARRR